MGNRVMDVDHYPPGDDLDLALFVFGIGSEIGQCVVEGGNRTVEAGRPVNA